MQTKFGRSSKRRSLQHIYPRARISLVRAWHFSRRPRATYNCGMTRDQDNTNRWRSKWSVRILLIVITLICAYLACWGPTKTWGGADVRNHVSVVGIVEIYDMDVVAPLFVSAEVAVLQPKFKHYRRYYFWFFGYVVKLPYERELPVPPPVPTEPVAMPSRR